MTLSPWTWLAALAVAAGLYGSGYLAGHHEVPSLKKQRDGYQQAYTTAYTGLTASRGALAHVADMAREDQSRAVLAQANGTLEAAKAAKDEAHLRAEINAITARFSGYKAPCDVAAPAEPIQ